MAATPVATGTTKPRAKRAPKVVSGVTTAQAVRKSVTSYVMSIGLDSPNALPIANALKALIAALVATPTVASE